jgi:hypothetical protein
MAGIDFLTLDEPCDEVHETRSTGIQSSRMSEHGFIFVHGQHGPITWDSDAEQELLWVEEGLPSVPEYVPEERWEATIGGGVGNSRDGGFVKLSARLAAFSVLGYALIASGLALLVPASTEHRSLLVVAGVLIVAGAITGWSASAARRSLFLRFDEHFLGEQG